MPVAFPAADGALGNASSFVAVRYSRHGEDFIQRAQALQDDVLGALDHLAFPASIWRGSCSAKARAARRCP